MLLLLLLYIYICYRWTKRIARRSDLRSSKLSFVAAVCLKMSWRIIVLSFALVLLVGGISGILADHGKVEEATQAGTETGIALAAIGFALSLLVAVFVALSAFHRRYNEQHARKPSPPQSPGSMAGTSESESSLENELRSLAALKAEGIISEEEFTAKKRALLGI